MRRYHFRMSPVEQVTAFVALGTNLGDRATNIRAAIAQLHATPGVRVTRQSSLLENPAVGGPDDSPPFLNAMVAVETTLEPRALLNRLLEIERALGRDRREKWEPRVIDLDLILYGNQVIDSPTLRVPHPLMHERRFVLEPLAEIAPDAVQPVLRIDVQTMLERLVDSPQHQRAALIKEIEAAFDGMPRRDGTTLHEAEVIDCYGSDEERDRARELDTEHRWQDVPNSGLEQHSSIWSFLDAEGLVYHLPAGMVWSLMYGESSASSTPDALLAILAYADRQEWCEQQLSPDQLRATARFVRFMWREYWNHEDSELPACPGLGRWASIARADGPTRFEPGTPLTTPPGSEP